MSRPTPIALSDDALNTIMDAARPLEPDRRSQFLERVAAELAGMPEDARGVGSIGRLCRQLQREHFSAPDLSRSTGLTKYERRHAR
jgi:hypothetical protein